MEDTVTYLANNVKPGAGVTTKVGSSRDRTVGHDGSGNVGLDEHAVCQCGIGGFVLLGGQGVQNRSVNPERNLGSSGAGGRRGGRSNTSGGIGILIAFGGDASEEGASRSVVGVAVGTRRTIASSGFTGWGCAFALSSGRDFSMDEAAPFTVGTRS